MAERGLSGGHPSGVTLKYLADGLLDEELAVAVEDHLIFNCPDGRCHRALHGLPNAIDAVLRAAARRSRTGGRRSCTS